MKIYHLQVDNKRDNLTVDCQNPVFGWRVEAEEGETDIRQRSYQIQVWDAQGREAWDSGRVESPGMCSIPYGGRTLRSSECFIWQVTCWLEYHARLEEVTTVLEEGNREPVSGRKLCKVKSEKAWFETGLFAREDWKGVFIGEREDHVYHLYRKIFSCGEQAPGASRVKKAKLYICGLGHFVCWMNGNRVSDHELEPGWTVYDKTCQYVAYDVTEKILPGDNAVLVKLGDGMFHVPGGRYVYYPRSYGKARLLFQLEITYTGVRCFLAHDQKPHSVLLHLWRGRLRRQTVEAGVPVCRWEEVPGGGHTGRGSNVPDGIGIPREDDLGAGLVCGFSQRRNPGYAAGTHQGDGNL